MLYWHDMNDRGVPCDSQFKVIHTQHAPINTINAHLEHNNVKHVQQS